MVFFTSRAICHSAGKNSLVLFLLTWSVLGCQKEEIQKYSDIPAIELKGLSHDTIRQYQDVLVIRIAYKDGNGDLGFADPEEYALFVRDIRLEKFDGFYVGPLAPPDVQVPIQGELTVEFPSLFLFGNGAMEQTKFQIRMIDRAGNESNMLETGFVTITRE